MVLISVYSWYCYGTCVFCNLRLRYCRFAGFVCLQLWGRGYSLRCYGEFVCSDLAGQIPSSLQRFNAKVTECCIWLLWWIMECLSFRNYGSLSLAEFCLFCLLCNELLQSVLFGGEILSAIGCLLFSRRLREGSCPHGFVEVFTRDYSVGWFSRYCT